MFSKKVVSAALSLAMAATSFASVYASTGFTDVKDTDSIASVSQRLNSLGIMQGVKNNDGTITFSGDKTFTRAQAAKVFVVSKGLAKVQAKAAGKFTDVAKDNWAYSWVNTAAQYGIVNGTSETTFAPSAEVTYGQLAAMAIRTLGYQEDDLDGSTFPYNYVQKATELGLFDGLDAVDVDAPATRADVAKLTSAMLDTATKAQQASIDAWTATTGKEANVTNGYTKSKTFFETVASKFGVKAIAGTTITATSATDSTLKANQFKVGTDTTVYTLPNASEDFSANFYKKYDGTFYVDIKDNTKVVFFDASKLAGTVKDAVAINTSVVGEVYNWDSTNKVKNNDYTIGASPVIAVNGAITTSGITSLTNGNSSTTVRLVDTNSDGTYDAIVATRVNNPLRVTTAPTSDVATTQSTIAVADANGATSTIPLTYTSNGSTVAKSVYVTGAATKLTEIKADDVIYAAPTDDSKAVALTIVRTPITGTVSKISADGKTVTVGGVDYCLPLANSVNGTTISLGDVGTFVVDSSKNAFKFTTTSSSSVSNAATVGAAVYGVPVAAAQVNDSWSGVGYKVRFVKVDGTSTDISVSQSVYNDFTTSALKGTLCYYFNRATTDNNGSLDSNGVVIKNFAKATLGKYNKLNKASDTLVLNIASDLSSATVTTQAGVNWDAVTNVYSAVKNNNSFGDYYLVAMVNAPAPASTTVGYVESYDGQEYVGTTLVKDYTVYENGTKKSIKVDNTKTQPAVGQYYTSISTGTDGVTTAVATTALVTDTVTSVDGTARIKFANAALQPLLSNVVVIKKTSNAVGTLSDVAADTNVGDAQYYVNSDGNVALIVLLSK